MGYWATSPTSSSLFTAMVGGTGYNDDGSEMLWGDSPADAIGDGVDALIIRLHEQLDRWPSVSEVEVAMADAPEIARAITRAKEVFARDIERDMTDAELAAGLAFAGIDIYLDSAMRDHYGVGDRIRWAEFTNHGGAWSEIDHIAEGEVVAFEFREKISRWSGKPYLKAVVMTKLADGTVVEVDKAYASGVLDTDPPIEEVNAARRAREKNNHWDD